MRTGPGPDHCRLASGSSPLCSSVPISRSSADRDGWKSTTPAWTPTRIATRSSEPGSVRFPAKHHSRHPLGNCSRENWLRSWNQSQRAVVRPRVPRCVGRGRDLPSASDSRPDAWSRRAGRLWCRSETIPISGDRSAVARRSVVFSRRCRRGIPRVIFGGRDRRGQTCIAVIARLTKRVTRTRTMDPETTPRGCHGHGRCSRGHDHELVQNRSMNFVVRVEASRASDFHFENPPGEAS